MKTQRLLALLTVAGALLTCSCTLMQQPVAVAPVGPAPGSQPALADTGFLKVFTAVNCGSADNMVYIKHTDYGIYDTAGSRVKSVYNADSFQGQDPVEVALPAGQYTVQGWSDAYRLVKVPVAIKTGCLTTVNLEKDDHGFFRGGNASDLVQTPDGRIVGWSSSLTTR